MKIEPETIGDVIALHIEAVYTTQKRAAVAWEMSLTHVNQIVHGERRPTEKMLADVGMKHVETWVPAKTVVQGLPMKKAPPSRM